MSVTLTHTQVLPPANPLIAFGDESTTRDVVTYGIVAFNGPVHEYDVRQSWNNVIENYGAPRESGVHCRELFHTHPRSKSPWAHLSDDRCRNLVHDLMKVVSDGGAFFSIGVVHKATYPAEGMPDGIDDAGEQKYAEVTNPLCYAFGYVSACIGLRSDKGVLKDGMQYSVAIDPISNAARLWGMDRKMQVVRMMEQFAGVKPTVYSPQPQMLDAADVYSYCAARALSEDASKLKDFCAEIYRICPSVKTDWWCQLEDQISDDMLDKLNIDPAANQP